jgi:zinc and cadmium transporter
MTQPVLLAFYAGAILVAALAGGALPLLGNVRRSDAFLSFSAGVMLGAAFFHMLPEAVESAGMSSVPFVLLGFLFLFLLERFVLVHVCAEPGPAVLELEGGVAAPVPHVHAHVHGDGQPCEGTGCAVHTVGLAAFVGLSLHTMIDGFALGAASTERALGFLVFLAILAHKVPSSFSLSAILRAEGYSRRRALAMNAAFSLTVPLGAGLYMLLRDLLHAERFTAFALAASSGTFLHLALSDILPDLHRRGGSKLRLSAALLVGVLLMWALRLVTHEH